MTGDGVFSVDYRKILLTSPGLWNGGSGSSKTVLPSSLIQSYVRFFRYPKSPYLEERERGGISRS